MLDDYENEECPDCGMDLHKIVTKPDVLLPGDECPNCGHIFLELSGYR